MKKQTINVSNDLPAEDDQVSPGPSDQKEWFDGEQFDGQLAVDVYQTETAIIIKSPIAGVEADDIDVSVNRDVVTIRGRRRQQETVSKQDYLFQECYWGGFSRSIILPTEVAVDNVVAEMKNGILTITLPKTKTTAVRVVRVQQKE